jgi:uncharacterized protein YegP (UPF0339 family)
MYQDRAKQWRWYLLAANGKKIADSGEGYNNETDCRAGINLVKSSSNAPIVKLASAT